MAKLKELKPKTQIGELKKPTWLKYTENEVRAIILKLANKGLTSEKIGLVLKNQYGIPKVKLYKIKIKNVLDNFQEPTIINLEKKVEKINQHFKKNKGDKKAERALTITKAKLKKRLENIKNIQ